MTLFEATETKIRAYLNIDIASSSMDPVLSAMILLRTDHSSFKGLLQFLHACYCDKVEKQATPKLIS